MPNPVSNVSIYVCVYSMHYTCIISITICSMKCMPYDYYIKKNLDNFNYVLFFYLPILKLVDFFVSLVVIFVLAEVFVLICKEL